MGIDYAALYGVLPGEKDFSGAIKRHLKAKRFANSSEYREARKALHDKAQQLILDYNIRMNDDVYYPNKDEVRTWYNCRSQELINRGVSVFLFLYPDFIGPIEDYLEKIYNKTNKNIGEKNYE